MAEPKRRLPLIPQHTIPLHWIEVVREDTPPVPGGTPAPLPGYLCEVCLDAPAVTMAPALGGGEMGVCAQCRPGSKTP